MALVRYVWRVIVGVCCGGWRRAPAPRSRLEDLRDLLKAPREHS